MLRFHHILPQPVILVLVCRGGLNMMFQLAVTVGILVAQLINYGASLPGARGPPSQFCRSS
jgi:hypothetical protein